jgi:hypothetical protein
MRYLRSYRFLFDNTHRTQSLLGVAVCEAIPVLGQIIFTGYAFDMIEALDERGDTNCPAFDTSRLSAYVTRGLWPLIVQLVVLLPVLFVAWIVGMVLVALIAGDPGRATGVRVFLALLFPIVFVAVLGLSIVLAPLTLYVGVRQELSGAAIDFVRDFLRRVGRETALAQAFIATTGTSLIIVGTLLLCLPVLPALALVHFAQYHLLGQLYRLYRQRGGSAVPLPTPAPATEETQNEVEPSNP